MDALRSIVDELLDHPIAAFIVFGAILGGIADVVRAALCR